VLGAQEGNQATDWQCYARDGQLTMEYRIMMTFNAHLTTDTSIPCLSINFSFSSRSQYWDPTGRPPLGSWSKIRSLSSDFPSRVVDDLIKGTEERVRKSAAYRGRYT
jgi:hypothetical protein